MLETVTAGQLSAYSQPTVKKSLHLRIQSIDFLRGVVMIIMALDHVRDYFHYDAFIYSPTDLSKTNVALFFTRFITHYCAPVFVFLAGMSSYLYGLKKDKKELAFFLFTRGIWLVLLELFVVVLFRTFNPAYTYLNLQVIWAIGVSMIVLSAAIYIKRSFLLPIGILLVAGHNLLDSVHVQGRSVWAVMWAFLHDPNHFTFGHVSLYIRYPLLPWIGIMIIGYYLGSLYAAGYDPVKRRKLLVSLGIGAIILFMLLRFDNWYGDPAKWSMQKNGAFSTLSFFNVTKYPPSLLYTLITLGPALIFLGTTEKAEAMWREKIIVFGRVPMFYYLAHILFIHILAVIAALFTGYPDMIVLNNGVNDTVTLRGYGFSLPTVYGIWIGLVILLYPLCKWFEKYKRTYQSQSWWLSYL